MKIKLIFLGLFCSVVLASAQDSTAWSLEHCIKYAHENNISIKRQELSSQISDVNYQKQRYSLLPNLNADASFNVGFGRTLDQSTYQYSNNVTKSATMRVASSTTLFDGMVKFNNIKRSKTSLEIAKINVEKTKNDISIELANQYLQILYYQDLLAVAKEQYGQTQLMVDQTSKLVNAGSKSKGALLEVKSQLANESVTLVKTENSLNLAVLGLVQMLDIDSVKGFSVVVPVLPEILPNLLTPPDDVFASAVGTLPQIKSSQLNVEGSSYDLAIAKGGIYPTLSFNAGWQTNASFIKDLPSPTFTDVFSNNSNTYVGLTLGIPIFNGHSVTSNIKTAKFNLDDAQYQLTQQKLILRKEVQTASNDAISAYKQYLASKEAVESSKEAFKYTQKRFEVETINAVDYNLAKTNLLKAESDFLQAKYQYIFKSKILDFYKGVQITL